MVDSIIVLAHSWLLSSSLRSAHEQITVQPELHLCHHWHCWFILRGYLPAGGCERVQEASSSHGVDGQACSDDLCSRSMQRYPSTGSGILLERAQQQPSETHWNRRLIDEYISSGSS
jgi:hypothetical protein